MTRPRFNWTTIVPLNGDSGFLDTGVGSGFLGTARGTSGAIFTTAGTLKILVHFKNFYRTEKQVIQKKPVLNASNEQKERTQILIILNKI